MHAKKYFSSIFLLLTFISLSCNLHLPASQSAPCTGNLCIDGVQIKLKGQKLETYTVQLQLPDEKTLIFSCPQPPTIYESASIQFPIQCTKDSITLISYTPENLSLVVNWENGSVKSDYALVYDTIYPNGSDCPSCKHTVVEMSLKNAGTPVASLFPTATPTAIPINSQIPQGKWIVAGEDTNGDWLVYSTPSITAIALDENYIWAASYGGLLRWDRTTGNVLHYLAPQTPLPDNDVDDVILYDGKLYIATETGVAIFDRKDQWTIYKNDDIGLGEDYSKAITVINGAIWVANKTGVAYQSDGQWQTIKSGQDTFSLEIVSRIVSQQDEIYIEGAEKLGDRENITYRYADQKWEKFDTNLPEGIVAPDGTRWKNDGKEVFYSKDNGLNWKLVFKWQDYIIPLAVDEQGQLYLATDSDIFVFANNQIVEAYRFTDVGPELNFINIIRLDQSGRLWFATDGRGLTMFDGQRWQNWQPETRNDMRHDGIRGMAVTNEKVYAGGSSALGEGGVMIYDIALDQWSNYWPGESELSGGGVGGIAVNNLGQVYFPTATGILDIYENGEWQHISMKSLSNGSLINTSDGTFDADGNYWLGTDGIGIWMYDGRQWKVYSIETGDLQSNRVNALAFDMNGQLWAETGSGLAVRCNDDSWKTFQIPTMSENILFGDVAIDSQNRIWVTANFDILAVFNGQDWLTFTSDVIGETIWDEAITFDAMGRAWISTSSGVAIYQGQLSLPSRQSAITDCSSSPNDD